MNKNRKIAGVLAVTMVIGSVGMTGTNIYAADSTESAKEEVIYIMTDAEGNVENINAVNIFGKGSVTDYGQYSSVKMLNTTDPIEQDGDKITFTSDKEKVYYQGTMEHTEIPCNISFTYTLDGKEISPEDLAGKSGALEIHIKIDQNKKCTFDFYDNTALQINLTMDSETCENIQADGATLANVGADKQISYTVLPGKGLDAAVSADVTDFTMDAAAINGVRMNLDVDLDDDELMDKVTEIMDAAEKLNDGAGKLVDGTDTLSDGGKTLSDGADSMNQGVASLDEGITSLNTGVTKMQTALNTLNSQSANLTNGSTQVLSALQAIQSELSKVAVNTDQLKQLTDSSAAIKQGINDAYNGAVTLQKNLSYEQYKAAMAANGLNLDQLQAGNTEAIQNLSVQISTLSTSIAQLQSMPDYATNETYQAQVAQMQSQIASLQYVVTLLGGNNAAISGTAQYFNTVSGGTAQLVEGLKNLKNNYETFDGAINTMVTTLKDLTTNVTTLKTAINQLTEKYTTLNTGIKNYTDGVASITCVYTQISSGTDSLLKGSKSLVEGSNTLKQGTSNLYESIQTLSDGTATLKDGTQEFYEKTDGMDTKIEDTIDDMINDLTGADTGTTSFVSDKNGTIDSVQFVIKTAAIEKPEEEQTVENTTTKTSLLDKFLNLFKK